MVNMKMLGAGVLALGTAVGLTSCLTDVNRAANKASRKHEESEKAQQPASFEQKGEVSILPPLTQLQNSDTIVFKNRLDSIDYNKYQSIARENFNSASNALAQEEYALVNSIKQKYEQQIADLKQQIEKIETEAKNLYTQKVEEAEMLYKEGKITFEELEDRKEKAQEKRYNNKTLDSLESKLEKLETKQENEIEKAKDSFTAKNDSVWNTYKENNNALEKKYVAHFRQNGHTGPLQQDFGQYRVTYKSKEDSIKANEYIERHKQKIEQMDKYQDEIDKLSEKIDQQFEKEYPNYSLIDKLENKIASIEEKKFEGVEPDANGIKTIHYTLNTDSITKYTKNNPFPKDANIYSFQQKEYKNY